MSKGDFCFLILAIALGVSLVTMMATCHSAKRQELRNLVRTKYHRTVN